MLAKSEMVARNTGEMAGGALLNGGGDNDAGAKPPPLSVSLRLPYVQYWWAELDKHEEYIVTAIAVQ